MGIMVYSFLWVMQDLYHQLYYGILTSFIVYSSYSSIPCAPKDRLSFDCRSGWGLAADRISIPSHTGLCLH